MARNKITDLRNHLFEALEKLKDGDMKVETARAMADIGTVLVNSAKVEVQMMKSMGIRTAMTDFVPLPEGATEPPLTTLIAPSTQRPVPDEEIRDRYARFRENYYARSLSRDRDGDLHVKLVQVNKRGLREQIGAAIEQLREFDSMDALEAVMLAVPKE